MRPAAVLTLLLLAAACGDTTTAPTDTVEDILAWHDRLETTVVEGEDTELGDDSEWFGNHLPERDDIADWADVERSAAGRTWTVDTEQLATHIHRTRETLQHADQHCDSRCPTNIHQQLVDHIQQLGHTLHSN